MFRHGIIDVLATFSKTDIKKFGKFLNSPYFISNKNVILLFSALKKFHPNFDKFRISKSELWSKSGINSEYNDSTMRNLLSDLHQGALKFLTVENLFKTGNSEHIYLMTELNNRDLFMQVDKQMNKILKVQTGELKADMDEILTDFMLGSVYYDSRISHKVRQTREKIQKDIDILRESIFSLIIFSITQLTVSCFNENIAVENSQISVSGSKLSDVLDCIDTKKIYQALKGKFRYDYLLEIYMKFIESFKDHEDRNKFFSYYKSVRKHSDKLSQNALHTHYAFLVSYCVNKPELSKLEFDIYKNILTKIDFGKESGIELSYVLFRNAFLKALNINEFEWAEMFLKKYYSKLNVGFKEDIFNYGMSRINFEKGSYSESQSYLNEVSLDISSVTNDVKILQLRIFLETGYYDNAYYYSESYLKFLKTYKIISQARKLFYRNFVEIVREISLYATQRKKSTDIDFLKQKIIDDKNIIAQDWLLKIVGKFNPDNRK